MRNEPHLKNFMNAGLIEDDNKLPEDENPEAEEEVSPVRFMPRQ